MDLDLPSPQNIELTVYRNIATCSPSQAIYDDLVDTQKEFDILFEADALSNDIDENLPKKNRVKQYGDIENSLLCFNERYWRWGRFGDGSFGVWYSAIEEETSIQETLFHRPEIDKNDLGNAIHPIMQDRRMFKAELSSHISVDLRKVSKKYPLIIHESNYEFCQNLGKLAVDCSWISYQTPSVRNPGGTCVPVFNSAPINDRMIYDYYNHFPLDGSEPYYSMIQKK
ncbi:MAG: RES family NAD+ phosphorylase [Oligoflexales bacterium]|nr:RES family NAD+ phosphorylase [Oligoflexales bacterium]